MRPTKDIPFYKIFFKIVKRYFYPSLFSDINDILSDPRDTSKIKFSLNYIFWVGIFVFVFKLEARRRINFMFNNKKFISNLSNILSCCINEMAHSDTVNKLVINLKHTELSEIRYRTVYYLIRSKVLDKFRFYKSFVLVIDGTGYVSFKYPHCKRCIKVELNNGSYEYRHNIVEAKFAHSSSKSLTINKY